jgi:hypothetical protein
MNTMLEVTEAVAKVLQAARKLRDLT